MKTINDPATYRELSEPFADGDAATAALEAFFQDLVCLGPGARKRRSPAVAQYAGGRRKAEMR